MPRRGPHSWGVGLEDAQGDYLLFTAEWLPQNSLLFTLKQPHLLKLLVLLPRPPGSLGLGGAPLRLAGSQEFQGLVKTGKVQVGTQERAPAFEGGGGSFGPVVKWERGEAGARQGPTAAREDQIRLVTIRRTTWKTR